MGTIVQINPGDVTTADVDRYVDRRIAELDVDRYGRGTALAAIDAVSWAEGVEPWDRAVVATRAASLPGALLDRLDTPPAAEVAAFALLATVARTRQAKHRWIDRAFAAGRPVGNAAAVGELAAAVVEGVA